MPRILVVDDDPMVCVAIEVYLKRQGFDVTVADGADAGMRALEQAAFDVMLIDVFMPHMRGFESIRIFHERAPDFLRMTLELGAARCLSKPFAPGALPATVNECLAGGASSARLAK